LSSSFQKDFSIFFKKIKKECCFEKAKTHILGKNNRMKLVSKKNKRPYTNRAKYLAYTIYFMI